MKTSRNKNFPLVLFISFFLNSCNAPNQNKDDPPELVNRVKIQKVDSFTIEETKDSFDVKAFQNNTEILRKEYTASLKNRFLDMGLDVKCIREEIKGKRILILQNAMFNDAWLKKLQDHQVIIEAMAWYDKVVLKDGFGYQSSSY